MTYLKSGGLNLLVFQELVLPSQNIDCESSANALLIGNISKQITFMYFNDRSTEGKQQISESARGV